MRAIRRDRRDDGPVHGVGVELEGLGGVRAGAGRGEVGVQEGDAGEFGGAGAGGLDEGEEGEVDGGGVVGGFEGAGGVDVAGTRAGGRFEGCGGGGDGDVASGGSGVWSWFGDGFATGGGEVCG